MSLVDQGAFVETGDAAISPRPHRPDTRISRIVTRPVGGSVKRAIDITIATTALIVLSPLFLFVAILLRLTDPGPVFFGHKRVGLGGRSFRCLKFRTMCTDADAVLQRLLASDPPSRRNGRPRASCATIRAFPASAAFCAHTPSMSCRS
jgi:lipopolysaccharide/colanic/teichoic acid biosynthesis glycosyltransferase